MAYQPSSTTSSAGQPVRFSSSLSIPSRLSNENPVPIRSISTRFHHENAHHNGYLEKITTDKSTTESVQFHSAGGSREPLRPTMAHPMNVSSPTTPSRRASVEELQLLASPCEQYVRRRSSLQKGQVKPRSILRRRPSDENDDPMLGMAFAVYKPTIAKRTQKRVSFARVKEDGELGAHTYVSGHKPKHGRLSDLIAEDKQDRYNCRAVHEPTYNVVVEPPATSQGRLHRVGASPRGHPVKSYVEDLDDIVHQFPTLSLQGSDDMDVDQRSYNNSRGVFGTRYDTGAREANVSRRRRYTPY